MVDFLTPIAAGTNVFTAASALTLGTPFTTFTADTADAPFGRNLVAGALAGSITVSGRDYLGQGITELIATGATGVKAFKWIDSISTATTGAHTLTWGARLGLPFRMSNVMEETANGAESAVGTFTAGVLTDPQTSTTGDPRGLYTPTIALNGSNRVLATFLPYNVLNANGNGGLFGIRGA
jgi:hypothetical protein